MREERRQATFAEKKQQQQQPQKQKELNARLELLLNRHESLLRHNGNEVLKLQQANIQLNANHNRHRIELQQEKHNWERKFDELKLQHCQEMNEAKKISCSIM